MLCLVMIVRNEERILARCLQSARPYIQRWLIVDTGSTDDTMAIVQRELAGIPGKLEQRPWVNFGHNRQESVALARSELDETERAQTWALLLDADFELQADGFDPSQLEAAAYRVLQRDTGLEYPNTRLLRLDREWPCTGSTHEYWPNEPGTPLLTTLRILDHNDGSGHATKYARDRDLLMAELKSAKNGAHERAVFYLGQTLEGMKDSCALDLYRWRTELGGYNEESWMAHYRSARMIAEAEQDQILFGREIGYESLRLDDLESVPALLHAYARMPSRAEPLWRLARLYRFIGQPILTYLFAKAARAIPKPTEGLFVEHSAYDEGIDEELAISAYYVGDHLTGAAACERLVHRGNIEGQNNLPWYTPLLGGERGTYEVDAALRTFDGVEYYCSNPSVCGPLVNVRLVGYKQVRGKHYDSLYGDGVIRTQNAIRVGDRPPHIIDDSILRGEPWVQGAAIRGLEDVRLVVWKKRAWFTASCCQAPGAKGWARVVLGRLSTDLLRVEHLVPIQYGGEVEKNWLLWPNGDRLRCIYAFSPLTVLDLDPETGAVLSVHKQEWSAAGRLRGSSPPIRLLNGYWLSVAHDVAHRPEENVYTHRFVAWKDGDLRVSGPFFLEHYGIEYCCGAWFDVDSDTVVLSYGFEDREAHWLKVPLRLVLQACNIQDEDVGGHGLPMDNNRASHSA